MPLKNSIYVYVKRRKILQIINKIVMETHIYQKTKQQRMEYEKNKYKFRWE